jgi:hypothetical protein
MKMLTPIAASVFLLCSAAAHAFPIAAAGTEGFLVIASGGSVTAKYEGNSAAFSNDLFLVNTGAFIFNNHTSLVGSTVNLGSFAAGTELVFRLHVNNTGFDYFSGPASRNPDNLAHARVQANWMPNTTLVSFEDLFGTPEGVNGYNDLSFSFTNTVSTPAIPEPQTYALLFAGLGVLGVVVRRRKQR